MSLQPDDPGCREALVQAVGHQAPFAAADLAALDALTVVHARDLAALEACTGLRRLTVLASDVPSFDFCEELTKLTHLQVLASRVASFNGIAFCTALEHIDLLFTSISEAGDLMGVSTFARGMLVGNPWTEPRSERASR
ncbi:MAG: hypothetical protein HC863_01180 [Myxococcales bacterium]|nr:hypothetical protein [Myxococcales bacterium]